MAVSGLWSKGPPAGPVWLLWIKVAILVLSVIVLALSAYALSVYGKYTAGYLYSGYSGAAGLLIFVVIKTWIIYGALLFFELKAPQMYFRIIGVIGYIFGVIFWLSGWAWAASYASFWLSLNRYCYGSFCQDLSDPNSRAFGGAMAGCAAIGAVIWVLSIVNLVFFIRGCLADDGTTVHNTTVQNAELGHVPKQAEAQAQPQYGAQPQQAYGQQPVYGQQPAYGAQPYQQTPYAQSPPPQQTYPPQ